MPRMVLTVTSYGKTKQTAHPTDIYDDLMTQERAVQLVNETNSEDKFEGFQWKTLLLIWIGWLLYMFVDVFQHRHLLCAELVNNLKHLYRTCDQETPWQTLKMRQLSLQQDKSSFYIVYLIKPQTIARLYCDETDKCSMTAFYLHFYTVHLGGCSPLCGVLRLTNFQEKKDAVARASYTGIRVKRLTFLQISPVPYTLVYTVVGTTPSSFPAKQRDFQL